MASLYLILVRWRLNGIIADISLSVLKEKTQFHTPHLYYSPSRQTHITHWMSTRLTAIVGQD